MKHIVVSILLLFTVVSRSAAESYTFYTNWILHSQFAGYTIASHDKMYETAGINLNVQYHDSVTTGLEMLLSGRAQFANMSLLDALDARRKGVKIVNIFQNLMQSSYCIVSYNPLTNIEDLAGQEVAVWRGFGKSYTMMVNNVISKPVKWHELYGSMEVFYSYAIDNILCTNYNELLTLEEIGLNIPSNHVLNFSDIGLNIPEDGVYCTEDFYREHKDVVDKFVTVSTLGWLKVRGDRDRSVMVILEEMRKQNLPGNMYHEKRTLDQIIKMQLRKEQPETAVPTFKLPKYMFEDVMMLLDCTIGKEKQEVKYEDFVIYAN